MTQCIHSGLALVLQQEIRKSSVRSRWQWLVQNISCIYESLRKPPIRLRGKKQSAEPWELRGWGGGEAGVEREEGKGEGRHSVATFLLFLRVAVALIFNEAGAGWTSGASHALQPALDELAQITPGAGTQSLAALRLWRLSSHAPVNIMSHHVKSLLKWTRDIYAYLVNHKVTPLTSQVVRKVSILAEFHDYH